MGSRQVSLDGPASRNKRGKPSISAEASARQLSSIFTLEVTQRANVVAGKL